jgi:hypothetical protein
VQIPAIYVEGQFIVNHNLVIDEAKVQLVQGFRGVETDLLVIDAINPAVVIDCP